MAERDPTIPQSDDPDLSADVIRLLKVVGPLGRFNVADFIMPVVNLGDIGDRSITARQPAFRREDVFTAGVQTAAPANTTHATTNALLRGTYDIQLYISPHTTEAHVWTVNAIETLGSKNWKIIVPINGPGFYQTLAYELGDTSFLTIKNDTLFGPGVQSVATIFARIRT